MNGNEATGLAGFAQDVARFYGTDRVKAGVQVSYLGDRAGWYVAVHRYPGDGARRIVVTSARLDGLSETVENCEMLWKVQRRETEPPSIDDSGEIRPAEIRRPARSFQTFGSQREQWETDKLRRLASGLGNLVRNVGQFYISDKMTGSVSLALMPSRAPEGLPLMASGWQSEVWYAAVHRFPKGAGSRRVVAWASAQELHETVETLAQAWMKVRNLDTNIEPGKPFTEADEATAALTSRASALLMAEPTRRIELGKDI